jgi:hypothetical protein
MFLNSGEAGIPSGTYKGWIVNGGPFPTEAAAKKDLVTGPPSVVPGLSGLAAIGDFFSRLSQPNTWARVGEVLIGSMVLGVGVYALVKNTEAGQAMRKTGRKTAGLATTIGTKGLVSLPEPKSTVARPRTGDRVKLPHNSYGG